jgi:hypothetical protein
MAKKQAGSSKAVTKRVAAKMKVRETAAGYAFEERARTQEPPRKKNIRLHQWKIDEARAALGTTTETETIEAALDLVVFRQQLVDGIRAMRGAELEDVFGADA